MLTFLELESQRAFYHFFILESKGDSQLEIITASMLDTLSCENKRKFEGMLPLIVKKLILNSCTTVESIRIPHGDDIWAPSFDGVVTCSEGSTYVPEGTSVWEFGTNKHTLEKVNADYKKRVETFCYANSKDTCFIFVTPKIWAYRASIAEWESTHKDWKHARIYDANILCDWINNEPAVAAWLLEEIYGKEIEISTIEQAWRRFASKTNPCLSPTLFLQSREENAKLLLATRQDTIVRVKADTYMEALGFVLSALMGDPTSRETNIVVNNSSTYYAISHIAKSKTIIMNYKCNHEVYPENNNKFIICYGKQDVSVVPSINLPPLKKHHYINAFKNMGILDAENLYKMTHGNLRALIRRIPGTSNDTKPEWACNEQRDLLAPLLFLGSIDRNSAKCQHLVEEISGEQFSKIDIEYQKMAKMEDYPLKLIENNYILVSYEEAWNTLQYSIYSPQFEQLKKVVISELDAVAESKENSIIDTGIYDRHNYIDKLIENLIYFSIDNPDSDYVMQIVNQLLSYLHIPNTYNIILRNMSTLAEAAPMTVGRFLRIEAENADGYICSLCNANPYRHGYRYVLEAAEELAYHKESAANAVGIFYQLYQASQNSKTSDCIFDHLIEVLCFYNTFVALTLKQKVEFVSDVLEKDPLLGSKLVLRILQKSSVALPIKYGKREVLEQQTILLCDYNIAIEKVSQKCFEVLMEHCDGNSIILLLSDYCLFSPQFVSRMASLFKSELFTSKSLAQINYCMRKMKYYCQESINQENKIYISSFDLWINKTDSKEMPYAWRFFDYFDCPDDELLQLQGDNLSEINTVRNKIREEAFQTIYAKLGFSGVKTLVEQMEDSYAWGQFLANNMHEQDHESILDVVHKNGKETIMAGIVDNSPRRVFDKLYAVLSNEEKARILKNMKRNDVIDWLDSDDEMRNALYGKTMLAYDEKTYRLLLMYNPVGLIPYCYNIISVPPLEDINRIMQIINAICMPSQWQESMCLKDEIMDILSTIDKKIIYTEEWGCFCAQLCCQGKLLEISNAAEKYFFSHPFDLVRFAGDDDGNYTHVLNFYMLPDNAYTEAESFDSFVHAFVDSGYLNLLGRILGRSIKGTDDIFPHEYVREFLEEMGDENFDQEVVIGFLNNLGVRVIGDGSDQKALYEKYKADANNIGVKYYHASSILCAIANSYLSKAKSDFIESEIMP